MPSFCRHNRLLQNCPICTKEQNIEMRPAVSRFGENELRSARSETGTPASARTPRSRTTRARGAASCGMTVRRMTRDRDDGFQSALVPGLRSAADAGRLADELAFAETRRRRLSLDPPGLYAELSGDGSDLEQRSWLAFQIAWLSPLATGEEPFAAISAARTPWSPVDEITPDPAHARCGQRGG